VGEVEIYTMIMEMKDWYPQKLYLKESKIIHDDYPEEVKFQG
jgi:hypothetical protein